MCGSKRGESRDVLGNANLACIVARDILGLGASDVGLVVIGAEVVDLTANVCNVGLKSCIVGEDALGGLGQTEIDVVAVLVDVKVGLGLALLEVEANAAGNLFHVNVNCHSGIFGGAEVVACGLTVEVEVLTKGCVVVCKLVCGILYGSLNRLCNVLIGGLAVNVDRKGLGLGLGSAGSGQRQGDGGCLVGQGNGQLAGLCIVGCAIGCGECPGESNVIVSGANQGQSDLAVLDHLGGNVQIVDLDVNFFGRGLFNLAEILKAVCTDGDEVECAIVNRDQTGYVCGPGEVFCVCSLHSGDLVGGYAVVGGGEADVGFQTVQLEVVIALAFIGAGDLNALDGNEHCLLACECGIGQLLGIGVDLGEINGGCGGDVGIQNFNGCFNKLVGSVVEVLLTGGKNGHAFLNACINGVSRKTVDVVSALIVDVLQIQAVCAVVELLGKNTGNDTLHHQSCIVFSGCVLCKGSNLEHGNLAVEGLLDGVAFRILDGCGQCVGNVSSCSFVNVDGKEACFFAFLNSYALGYVNRPLNGVSNVADHNLTNYVVVGGGFFCVVLINTEQIVTCFGQALVFGAACGKNYNAQSQQQENRK